MSTPQCPHVSGRRGSNEPDQHGINDGSGVECVDHSYSKVDKDGKAVTRDESLTEILISKGVQEVNLISAIVSLGEATTHIAALLQNYVDHSYAGTQNSSGDEQLHLDIDCDNACFHAIRDAGVFITAASEETPEETDVSTPSMGKEDGPWYSVGFDPLDGSSIIDANFSVGSIFGIWPGKGLLGRTGREQVSSVVSLYGPRTTLIIALPSKSRGDVKTDITFEVTLVKDRSHWEVSREEIVLKPAKKVFAPGNLRATNDNPKYDALVKHWIQERYTLRYTGGMVPDVYHMFAKSGGVFSNVSSEKARAKLRLLYEVAAMGLLVECAGGVTTHEFEDTSVLDLVIDDLDRRLGVCFGSKDEVQTYKQFMFSK
mmetsp:Transcript_6898/g.15743  ORF Transcript_6898/g.15743 Transcript_6898/m.15743 type:complete len:372 (+) Transcript_6898:65-1180(+)|eukprot:CAMPEP_0172297094 /NCGR_PEP_ID=MMETSP1058-20130122/238_1 /TAXON_ID=83371 /ORGANISM="Detonula confervacea, Strain CCMP 353" /LENGTH=371 /DNA_ID=CAMNT_0013006201 /DNA_START=37 /DNA_END=1152 /DNA_ORIENTATION=+